MRAKRYMLLFYNRKHKYVCNIITANQRIGTLYIASHSQTETLSPECVRFLFIHCVHIPIFILPPCAGKKTHISTALGRENVEKCSRTHIGMPLKSMPTFFFITASLLLPLRTFLTHPLSFHKCFFYLSLSLFLLLISLLCVRSICLALLHVTISTGSSCLFVTLAIIQHINRACI